MSVPPVESPAAWVARHTDEVKRLQTAANLAGWRAATTGDPEDIRLSAEARAALRRLYSDSGEAARVRGFLAEPSHEDPLLHRQLVLLDLTYTGNQLPPSTIDELTRREAALEEIFYNFRASFEGGEPSNNELLDVLRNERDGARRRAAWEASKQVGNRIEGPLRDLLRQRNAAARGLGFENFYSMELTLQEISESELFALLNDFRRATDEPFAALRREMDEELARLHGVSPTEVYPWHWEDFFSQEAPGLGAVDLDALFDNRDPVEIARRYFASIGLPVEDVLARSDLYEREGKDQHAFATDIDRVGDVRILCNLRPNERWMSTLLHELGHAVYNAYLPDSLPYLLRCPAHTLSTEAIAMLLGRLTRSPEWLAREASLAMDPAAAVDIERQLRLAMLVSARWILVMVHFERELYRDPDRQDLNTLWWDLVEELQMVRRPPGRDAPDWAAKIHLALAPVYYHNYLLGEMMASQLAAAMRTAGATDGGGAVGDFLRERLFALGATLPWNAALVQATGEPLTSRFFIEDFVSG
jgi:peptidyl-dipeptidase A